MVAATYAKIITVKIERGGSGAYFATSQDLKGFLAVSPDRNELEELIPQHIADLYKASGHQVVVSRVEDRSDDDGQPWVAFPLEVARAALEKCT